MPPAQSQASAPAIVNGVNVTALFDTIEAVKGNAEIAKFNFRAKNAWLGGDHNRTTMKDFTGALGEHRTGVQAFIAKTASLTFCSAKTARRIRLNGYCTP